MKLELGSRILEGGSWSLEVGAEKMEVGSWTCEIGPRNLEILDLTWCKILLLFGVARWGNSCCWKHRNGLLGFVSVHLAQVACI